MALSRSRPDEIPKDAVILKEDEALRYQWKIISGWEKVSEVWALRYSSGILAVLSVATSVFVNNHYRKKLRLGNYGKLSSYLPIVVIPAMFSMMSHRFFIQRPIMLGEVGIGSQSSTCPLCLQLRAAALQSGMGTIYPTILSPFAAFMFATRHYTYRLPSITAQPLEVFNLYRKMTKPIIPTLTAMIIAQSVIAMLITYKETEQNFLLQMHLQNMEKRIEDEFYQNQEGQAL